MDLSEDEKLQASAVAFLIEGQEIEEAALLISCKLKIHRYRDDFGTERLTIEISGARTVYEIINNEKHPTTIAIRAALNATLEDDTCSHLYAKASFPNFGPDWRSQLIDAIQNRPALNLGIIFNDADKATTHIWKGLRFRSPVEMIIAKTLEQYNVLYLPDCMARLGPPSKREPKEADFLICYEGKWGVLEVDGETYHTSAARDHDRDRLFKHHGIKECDHYTAKRCLEEPKKVVEEFLALLKQNG